MSDNSKQVLPKLLYSMVRKLSAVFFKRLVLLEEGSEDETNSVVEYDHHCEGAEIMLDFMMTRKQAILLKAFAQLRQYQPQTVKEQFSSRHPAISKKHTINTTKRTFLNTTLSDASPIRQLQSYTCTLRTNKKEQRNEASGLDGSKISGKTDMEKLLSRVKLANSRAQISYSFRQGGNESQCGQSFREMGKNPYDRTQHLATPSAYYSRVQPRMKTNFTLSQHNQTASQNLSRKGSRRQFIMNKFSQIENTLHKLGKQSGRSRMSSDIMGEINSIKQRLRL